MHLEGPGLGPCLVPGWQDSPRGASLVSSVWTLPMLLLVELVLLCPVFLHEAAPPRLMFIWGHRQGGAVPPSLSWCHTQWSVSVPVFLDFGIAFKAGATPLFLAGSSLLAFTTLVSLYSLDTSATWPYSPSAQCPQLEQGLDMCLTMVSACWPAPLKTH